MVSHSVVSAIIALGMLLGMLWGTMHLDFEKVAALFPKEKGHQLHGFSVEDKLKEIVAEQMGVEQSSIMREASFTSDLGMDDLDFVEMVTTIEKEFNIELPEEGAEKLMRGNLNDAVRMVTKLMAKETTTTTTTADCYFDEECRKLVDWKRVEAVKEGTIARFRMFRNDKAHSPLKWAEMMQKAHSLLKDAKMPENRIDYVLQKWVKAATSMPTDEHHSWSSCKIARARCFKKGEKITRGRCHFLWEKCRKEVAHPEGCVDKGVDGVWCPKGTGWYCKENCIAGFKKHNTKPDADGCYDKGECGVWCPRGDEWHCKRNCNKHEHKTKPSADGCYDKGEDGVWCPDGDGWSCKENCPHEVREKLTGFLEHATWMKHNTKPDADGCYDKGEYGVWCPRGDEWYCKRNCKEKKHQTKPSADGCYDKGEDGVWCPKGDSWYCKENCPHIDYLGHAAWMKHETKPDADGCYDKGEYGVWCPRGDEWYCKRNCNKNKHKTKPSAEGCYDKGEDGVWCPKGDGWYCKENCPPEPDAHGCYDTGDDGVWCPKGDGTWYCKNCKDGKPKTKGDANGCYLDSSGLWCPKGDGSYFCKENCHLPDADGCYDKGQDGVWCPRGNGIWYCKKGCKNDKQKAQPDANGCYDKKEYGVWCPKSDGSWYCKKNCKK